MPSNDTTHDSRHTTTHKRARPFTIANRRKTDTLNGRCGQCRLRMAWVTEMRLWRSELLIGDASSARAIPTLA